MERAEIKIYGDIGDEITVASVNAQLEAIGKDVDQIDVYITSNGGSVIEGVGIANLLEKHPAKIRTIVRGGALSIAGFIACAGDERIIEEDSVLHVHGPHYSVSNGNMEDFEDAVAQLSRMKDSMARRYASITGKSTDEIKKLFERDHFYSPSEAVEIGFMTAIEPSSGKLAAFLDTANFQIPTKLEAAVARRMESQPPEDDKTMSKNPATLEELKAKLPGASADFIVSHALSKSTIDDAQAAYIAELEKTNKDLAAKAAKAMEDSEAMDDEAKAEDEYDDKLVEAIAARVKSMLESESMEDEDAEAMEDEDDEEAEAAMEDDNGVDETVVAKLVEQAVAKALAGQASAKKVVRNRLGTKAVRKPTMTPRQAATASASAEVEKLAASKVAAGMSKPNAVAAVLKENPKLRERMVAEANKQRTAQ